MVIEEPFVNKAGSPGWLSSSGRSKVNMSGKMAPTRHLVYSNGTIQFGNKNVKQTTRHCGSAFICL